MNYRYGNKASLRRGFTLIEIMVAVALFAMVAYMGLSNLGKSRTSSHPRAVAGLLAAELQQAHQRAVAKGMPVGVVVPTNKGTRGVAQAIYFLEGHDVPRITRVVNFGTEYPGAVIGVVEWPLASGSLKSDPLVEDSKFNVAEWAGRGESFQDLAFVYDSAGKLHTNGLSHFNREYHIAVAAGMTVSPGGLSDNSFTVRECGDAFTLSLGESGGVRFSKGLASATSGIEGAGTNARSEPAQPPSPEERSNLKPAITSIDYLPKTEGPLPDGTTAIVESDGYLTLTTEATDEDGGPLFVYWEATGGSFSYDDKLPMEWDLESKTWTSTFEWRPPPDDVPGTTYELTCYVQDAFGATVSQVSPALTDVMSNYEPKIYFQSSVGGAEAVLETGTRVGKWGEGVKQWYQVSPDGTKALWREGSRIRVSNIDGSEERVLPIPGNIQNPSWSPDGKKILYWNLNGDYGVRVCDADGTNVVKLAERTGSYSISQEPRWSPLGNRILGFRNGQAYLVNPDGTDLEYLEGIPDRASYFDFSPDGKRVVFQRRQPAGGIYTADLEDSTDDATPPRLSNTKRIVSGNSLYNPRWSPKGDQVAYYEYSSRQLQLSVVAPDGSGATSLGHAAASSYSAPSWVR